MKYNQKSGVIQVDNKHIELGLDCNTVVILSYMRANSCYGKFSNSIMRTALSTNTSTMTVKRAIKSLSQKGLIKIHGNKTNRYIAVS